MKIYISVDLEGIGGVVGSYQMGKSDTGAPVEVKRWATAEVNAAIEAAYLSGAEYVLVNENHSGKDLILEELDPRAEVLMGKPKQLTTLEGLDESFSAVFLLGIHSKSGTPTGVLNHTWHPKTIYEMRVNGYSLGEIGLNALVAGHFRVPLALVIGDRDAVIEAKSLLEQVEGAVVKVGVGRYAALLYHPSRAHSIIQTAVKNAISSLHAFKPFSLGLPAEMEIDFFDSGMADRVEMVPTAVRIGPRTVSLPCENYLRLMYNLMIATILAKSMIDPVY
jgi:D-amino peptidase